MNDFLLNELGLQGIRSPLKECDPSEIEAFERVLGTVLPSDYRKFLLGYAPSFFGEDVAYKPVECSPWAVDGWQTMDIFYGISTDSGFDVQNVNKWFRGDIPDEMIVIGHDAGSNQLLLSLSDSTVHFFDRDSATATLVAETFTDFLASFRKRL